MEHRTLTVACDVPIDLDETSCVDEGDCDFSSFSIPVEASNNDDKIPRSDSDSSAVSVPRSDSSSSDSVCGEGPSSWSSSSGSFYGDMETSPIEVDACGKWYWDPNEEPEDKEEWEGKKARLNMNSPYKLNTTSPGKVPIEKIFLRSVWNRDTRSNEEVMAKRVQSNREIELIQKLNTSLLRCDPWNISPPLLSLVNDDSDPSADEPLAIFDPLVAYDSKPFATVEAVLDFVMQLLQGLVFLHENRVIHGDIHPDIIMMDTPPPRAEGDPPVHARFYVVDFTHASVVAGENEYLFQEDLRDLGLMIDRILGHSVPELSEIILEMTTLDSASCSTKKALTATDVLADLEDLVKAMSTERIKEPLA